MDQFAERFSRRTVPTAAEVAGREGQWYWTAEELPDENTSDPRAAGPMPAYSGAWRSIAILAGTVRLRAAARDRARGAVGRSIMRNRAAGGALRTAGHRIIRPLRKHLLHRRSFCAVITPVSYT